MSATWNYRIFEDEEGNLSLVEAHYKDGKLRAYSADPTSFVADAEEGKKGIVKALKKALRDASEYPFIRAGDIGQPAPARRSEKFRRG